LTDRYGPNAADDAQNSNVLICTTHEFSSQAEVALKRFLKIP